LVDRVRRGRFLAVFGPSGAGKSSLLRAGLIPRLPGKVVLFSPGPRPYDELAARLADLSGLSAATLVSELRAGPHSLHRIVRQAVDGDVLDSLVAVRLVTLDADTVEITHESLINAWPRLRDWLDEDREGLRVRRQLTEATDTWESLDHDPAALYRWTMRFPLPTPDRLN
jgi:hypothetical protein